MFWRRALSVVVLLPLVLLIVYQGGWVYLLLISAVVLLMQVEYCRLTQHFSEKLNVVMPTVLTVAFCLLAYFLPALTKTLSVSTVMFSFFTFVLIYVFAESIFRGQVADELVTVTQKLTGILTIGWSLGYHLILLRNSGQIGMSLCFLLAGTVWCGDTGAYLIGRAIGKHKLGTPVSPRKTIEGTIGGLVVGTLVGFSLGAFLLKDTIPLVHIALMALLLTVMGQLGDLSESLMKRTAGVKDSGDVIPGHGGLLDRCDSLIFSAPVLYYYLKLTGHLT